MIQRGRKAAAAGVNTAVVIEGGWHARPEPPDELTPKQTEIWRGIVAREDPELFATGAVRAMLADYCRRREAAEIISTTIDQFKPEWIKSADGVKRYAQLLRMRDLETRGVASLATKLRLTNQSRYREKAAYTNSRNELAKVAKPWEL